MHWWAFINHANLQLNALKITFSASLLRLSVVYYDIVMLVEMAAFLKLYGRIGSNVTTS